MTSAVEVLRRSLAVPSYGAEAAREALARLERLVEAGQELNDEWLAFLKAPDTQARFDNLAAAHRKHVSSLADVLGEEG